MNINVIMNQKIGLFVVNIVELKKIKDENKMKE